MKPRSSQPSTSEKLLEVGEKLFAAKGFHGVSLREVAKQAKTNIASVHYHFGDKYGFYTAIFESFFKRIRETIVAAKIEEMDPKDQVLLLNQIMQTSMAENQDFNRMFARALLNEGEPRLSTMMKKVLVENLKPLVEILGQITRGLQWKGVSKKVPEGSVQFMMIAMNCYWTLFSPAYAPIFPNFDKPEALRNEVFASVTAMLENLTENS